MDRHNTRLTAFTVGSVLGVLALSIWFVFDATFVELYWREIAGPRVERRFGFRIDYAHTTRPGRERTYVFTSVTPGKAFDRAGERPGDTLERWNGYAPRIDLFYQQLSESEPVKLRVVNSSFGAEWPKHVREVTVQPPDVLAK